MLTRCGIAGLISQTRVNVVSWITSSESSPLFQRGESNGDDLNCSILSYRRDAAIAICRLLAFALTAKENIVATATNPHVAIKEVINTSMRVNPRLRISISSGSGKGAGQGGIQIRTVTVPEQVT